MLYETPLIYTQKGSTDDTAQQGSDDGDPWADAPIAALSPVAAFPVSPVTIDPSVYDYDDLSIHAGDIEFFFHHYGVLDSDPNPISVWLSERYNANVIFTSVDQGDMESIIATRYGARDFPDVSILPAGWGRTVSEQLFDQGLVTDA